VGEERNNRRKEERKFGARAHTSMSQLAFLIVALLMVVLATAQLGRPGSATKPGPMAGGWSACPTADPQLLKAMNWGTQKEFVNLHPSFNVLTARKQVVAGTKYDATLAVTRLTSEGSTTTQCSVVELVIADQPWMTPEYTLLSKTTVNEKCPV